MKWEKRVTLADEKTLEEQRSLDPYQAYKEEKRLNDKFKNLSWEEREKRKELLKTLDR